MKLFQNRCEFAYPWEEVTEAHWKKYPNEMSTHVKATDVLRRELDPTGRKLVSERLITVQQSAPRWVMMLVGGTNISYVREVSTVDLDSQTLTLRSVNLTYANLLKVCETVTYSRDPVDPARKTLFEQEAQITAYVPFARVCNQLEEWSVQRYHDNAEKGKRGFETVLKALSRRWDQGERYVEDISSTIVTKVNETVDDLLGADENSLLSRYSAILEAAFQPT
ncbi:AGL126Cp [Eremothecium gossypii ATCC 10895]|uniref:AGL126Cp n=1 Tax=Eremothecium gossypii (strain ATCC 10895 / CBS 109.51 / FGSC 9923 / NRRL Y-1056) TaxID=284811 RepID=Q751A6_EREGS|nr:AGL126Cp [Eremothecium gossypii ATCC 10895]AAS54365.1 AGL126Cp [Eremothecium gossypii ATCC 10895]AEY98692.1 FAGL126Cp [Eremothecium gossypii FDAG1]